MCVFLSLSAPVACAYLKHICHWYMILNGNLMCILQTMQAKKSGLYQVIQNTQSNRFPSGPQKAKLAWNLRPLLMLKLTIFILKHLDLISSSPVINLIHVWYDDTCLTTILCSAITQPLHKQISKSRYRDRIVNV